MLQLDELVEQALEEEFVSENGYESDLSALSHAVGQVWRDLPPEMKSDLIERVKSILKQAGEDPKGLLWRILGLAGFLVLRRGLSPPVAAQTAAWQVLHQQRRKRLLRTAQRIKPRRGPPPPRPLSKKRWQRGRRGSRFDAWQGGY